VKAIVLAAAALAIGAASVPALAGAPGCGRSDGYSHRVHSGYGSSYSSGYRTHGGYVRRGGVVVYETPTVISESVIVERAYEPVITERVYVHPAPVVTERVIVHEPTVYRSTCYRAWSPPTFRVHVSHRSRSCGR
jgi:hypothetical protein